MYLKKTVGVIRTEISQVFLYLVIVDVAIFGDHVHADTLALDGVRHRHGRHLGDSLVIQQGRLDFGGGQQMAGDVQQVVGATGDPVVPVGVAESR